MKWIKPLLAALFAGGFVASAHAALLPRDLDGNLANGPEAYYDSVQDITWMTDWRQGDVGGMNWSRALEWADDLLLGGFDDWRLPKVGTPRCQAFNCTNGELGYLWYIILGNTAPTLSNRGPFDNMAGAAYWTGTGVDADEAWAFATNNGFQFEALTSNRYAVVAVRDGDTLRQVPEPATSALLAAALLAIGRLPRRKGNGSAALSRR